MSRWKLCRQIVGHEVFDLSEGDNITIGRSPSNKISLSSIVISRNHCLIQVKEDEVLLTDLKSSNGVFVGLKRIEPNIPCSLTDKDIIGFGWTEGASLAKVSENDKYVFKLIKCTSPLKKRIQNNVALEDITEISSDDTKSGISRLDVKSPVLKTNLVLKRKLESKPENVGANKINNVISISDSDTDSNSKDCIKKIKVDTPEEITKLELKKECEDIQFEVFDVKQEYFGDDEPIEINSDSDSESELFVRLSQSSPSKQYTCLKRNDKPDKHIENSSYSQLDDDVIFEGIIDNINDDFIDYPPDDQSPLKESVSNNLRNSVDRIINNENLVTKHVEIPSIEKNICDKLKDTVISTDVETEKIEKAIAPLSPSVQTTTLSKKTQMIDLLTCLKRNDKPDKHIENSSYSQLDDDVIFEGIIENINDDFIDYPPDDQSPLKENVSNNLRDSVDGIIDTENLVTEHVEIPSIEKNICDKLKDTVISTDLETEKIEKAIAPLSPRVQTTIISKKTQMIDPLIKTTRRKSHHVHQESKKSSSKYSKEKKQTSKKSITDSQKEERKRKLKEIASKEKDADVENTEKVSNTNPNKSVINVKVTTSNRGAFLTDDAKTANKVTSKRNSKGTEKGKKTSDSNATSTKASKSTKTSDKTKHTNENQTRHENDKSKTSKEKDSRKEKSLSSSRHSSKSKSSQEQISLKNLKPLTNSEESLLSKPVSKVQPLLTRLKTKKQVRFSAAPPEVREFEIEPGNQMRKICLENTSLVDARKMPKFSLEKITLMKILRWNPQWLDEQKCYVEPPPILGHNNPPTAILHNFNSHSQYVGLVGDLLLMEIWECLTQSYLRKHNNQNNVFQLRVESLPPVPPQERLIDLCNLSVSISLLKSEVKNMPRVGDIMILEFGSADKRNQRFFFVHNVRSLPSPINNKNSFFSLSLYATFTNKINELSPGELMIGRTIAYINKELMLFEAMEYLAGSPLVDAILRPQPHHFAHEDFTNLDNMETQWTKMLNPSQKLAVAISVSAALGHQPRMQMIQGPPGTGKSSVICSIVMTFFYNANNERQQNRGKILICATSNAAVDELVIRLLNIRQTLPKEKRFRMVRVGRLEAMHARARDVSSQQLAQRDAARAPDLRAELDEEIAHLEAKVNMWKIAEEEAKDNVRRTYCRERWSEIEKKILRHRGGACSGDRLAQAERRIIECADIIVTTLASAHNHKMRVLKGRIALCIVDEAGQAIEPEALIPLTLDVTRLTLIGDPQQLPGFICSQRAKQHGLGESLFSRLCSCAEAWGGGAVLLDQQYRMHAAIADYPNRAFYGGRLRSVPPAAPPAPPARALPPYALVGIASGDKGQSPTYANETEAWGVARVATALAREARARRMSLAVLTPYSAHRDLLRTCLRALHDQSEPGVEVSTVDSFQGQERDVVVVSLARSCGVGFLTDTGRMNVMLTRARHSLLVCLNPLALVKNNQWQTLIDDAQRRNMYLTLPSRMCQPASSMSISHEEVIKHIMN